MLLFLLIGIVILVAAFLLYTASRPGTFRVERTTTISNFPEKIFPLINDFHNWHAWSPFEKLDPSMKKTFSGALKGRGAVYEWNGNKKAGQGRMEILDSLPHSKVAIEITFEKPFKSQNNIEFLLQKHDSSVEVTWTMYGPASFMWKTMGIFVNMDNMIGKDFEEGLANLKALME